MHTHQSLLCFTLNLTNTHLQGYKSKHFHSLLLNGFIFPSQSFSVRSCWFTQLSQQFQHRWLHQPDTMQSHVDIIMWGNWHMFLTIHQCSRWIQFILRSTIMFVLTPFSTLVYKGRQGSWLEWKCYKREVTDTTASVYRWVLSMLYLLIHGVLI